MRQRWTPDTIRFLRDAAANSDYYQQIARRAAACTSIPQGAQIGLEIMRRGGNAVDAAVAMIFANSLTEPGATSLGGASFMTIYLKETGEYICIEAMETAPAAAVHSPRTYRR